MPEGIYGIEDPPPSVHKTSLAKRQKREAHFLEKPLSLRGKEASPPGGVMPI